MLNAKVGVFAAFFSLICINNSFSAEYKTKKVNGQTFVQFATGSFVVKESIKRRQREYLVEIVENDLVDSDKMGLPQAASIKSRQILNCASEQVTIVDAGWYSKLDAKGDILKRLSLNKVLPNESANQTAKRSLFGYVCS